MTGEGRRGARLAAGATGAALFAQLAVLRAAARATETSVTLAGRDLDWGCAFRDAFGFACPNCGLTRSVVLTLHGQFWSALGVNPAGPLLVLGTLLVGAALVLLAARKGPDPLRPMRRLMVGAAVYAGLVVLVLLANWVRVIT